MVMQDPPAHTDSANWLHAGSLRARSKPWNPKCAPSSSSASNGYGRPGAGHRRRVVQAVAVDGRRALPGVPEADRPQFDGWTEAIVAASGQEPDASGQGGLLGATEAVLSMTGYFTDLINRRRREPGDDVVSHLVAAGVGADGDTAGLLSILAFTFTMVTGGNDTTTGLLGGAVQLLHQRPDQHRLLADNPTLIPNAVEEFLRLTSPVQGLARTATSDITMHDTTIPAGRKVLTAVRLRKSR